MLFAFCLPAVLPAACLPASRKDSLCSGKRQKCICSKFRVEGPFSGDQRAIMAAPPPEEEGPPLTELEGLQLKCNTVRELAMDEFSHC